MTKGKFIVLTAVILLFLNVLIGWLNVSTPATNLIRLLSVLIGLIACFIPTSWVVVRHHAEHGESKNQDGKSQQRQKR